MKQQDAADARRFESVADALPSGLARGVLSFPLTSFHGSGGLDLGGFRTHVREQVDVVKAAARRRVVPVAVRVPVTDPGPEHVGRLRETLWAGLELVGVTDGLR